MIVETVQTLIVRDLKRLKKEIASYSNEENLWQVDAKISNSGGNLCLHLIGNLKEYIGKHIGGDDFVRDRDFEFGGNKVPKAILTRQVDETIDAVEKALEKVDDEILASDFPIVVFKEKMTYAFFLIHLSSHLTYHLGQVNYHRRLLDNYIVGSM